MATSPSFNWPEPDNTDLVKNGALAIRTAVDAIDTSMTDLLGGTTGQVLSKASATDMDFTWTTPSGGSNAFYAGKNKIINGDFNVNQRSFVSTTTTSTYMEDRWQSRAAGDGTTTHSIQTFTPGAAPVAGYEGSNFHRIVTTGQTSSTVFSALVQHIESVRTFAGQTATVSFWAKANSGTPNIGLLLIQAFGSGGSSNVTTTATKQAITTSWARYSFTINVPSISGKTIGSPDGSLSMFIGVSTGSDVTALFDNLGIQTNTFEIWGVQVEAGSVATAFQTATATIQGELAACQRYYWRGSAAENFAVYGSGSASSTTAVEILVPILQTMRVKPTSVDYASLFLSDGSGSPAISSITIAAYTTNTVRLNTATTGATQFRPYSLMNAGTSAGYLAFNAEL